MSQTYSKKVVIYVTFVISSLAVVMAFQMPQAQATRSNRTTVDSSGLVSENQTSNNDKSDKNKSGNNKSDDDDDKSDKNKSGNNKSDDDDDKSDKNKSENKKSDDDDDKSDKNKSENNKSDDDDDKSDKNKSENKKSDDDDDKSDKNKSENKKSDDDDDKSDKNKSENNKSDDNQEPSNTTRPLPIISFNISDIGKTFQFNFDGSVNEKNVTGLTSTAWLTLKNFTGTTADFDVALDNTSSNGITSRTSGFGFNVYTDVKSTNKLDLDDEKTTTSDLFKNALVNGKFPNKFGYIDVCFTDGKSCEGGQDGGVKTNDGIEKFSFSLAFDKSVNSFALGNFGVRYQSIDSTNFNGASGTGQGTYYVNKPPVKKVPESGTSLGLGLFVIGTLKLLKRKPRV